MICWNDRHAHRALAEVIDPHHDPDRRAWHRAHAAPGPDDDVADELAQSAGRAQARGGLAAAAAFLERATVLTVDPAKRAVRALDAAAAKVEAGALDAAVDLLAIAEAGPLDEFAQARLDLVRAQLAFVTSRGSDAPPLLLQAARRLGPIDAQLSRATYLDAMSAAMFAGRLAVSGGVIEVVRRRWPCRSRAGHPTRIRPPPGGSGHPIQRGVRGGASDTAKGVDRLRQ